MRVFFLLFLVFPLLELFVLIRVGSSIGALTTLLLVLAGGVFGVLCMRLAGLTTALKVRERMAQGEVPNTDMLNGLLMVVAGGLLFLPGFISDVVGLVCLLPITRKILIKRIALHMTHSAAQSQQFYAQSRSHTQQDTHAQKPQPQIIEGEFERKDP
jgi:UPF0716 protein FxsA